MTFAVNASPEWARPPPDCAELRLTDWRLLRGLRDGEVHVWRAAAGAADARVWEAPLALAEREAAGNFAFDRDRQTYVLAHRLLRTVLSAYLDVDAAEITFAAGAFGKPELAAHGGLCFNLTHSAGAAMVALAWEQRIGVDLESTQARVDLDSVMRSTLAPPERALIEAMPQAGRSAAFLQLWTRKEALLKAEGVGLSHNPRDYSVAESVTMSPAATSVAVAFGTRWMITDLEVGAAWRSAVAVGGGARPFRLFCLGWTGPANL
jgi:4'-phosphopantetheinyl transferase